MTDGTERMDRSMRTVVAPGGIAILVGLSFGMTSTARAQERPSAAPPAPAAAPSSAMAPSTMDPGAPLRVPSELLQVHPGGLTAEQAGARAAATSWNAKASEQTLRGAAARVDEAWAAFLPRLSLLGKYTRLSNFASPSFFNTGGENLVVTPVNGQVTGNGPLIGVPVSFPSFFVLDNWLMQATITVPISDYFLSVDQKYTAATRSQEAARWDETSARATALSDGQVAYYTWLRNRGAVIVAVQALNDQKTHLRDARNQFDVGNASKADVLRAETAAASAELAVEQASNLSDLTEKQLRVAMHLPADEAMLPGEDLDAPVQPLQGNLPQMTVEALGARPEVKSADANAASAREQASAARAGRWPTLSAFGDGILGDPNPRVIPPSNKFVATWDVGAQITWSPNDVLVAGGSVSDFESRAAAIEANKSTTRDGIEVEVQQDWQGVREADFAIDASKRELSSAEEAYRVARELFNNGRGTSTTLTDAETDLTRARLDLLNAKANARIARIRLDHALGRDVRAATASAGATAPRN
jgi:outer membrane protein